MKNHQPVFKLKRFFILFSLLISAGTILWAETLPVIQSEVTVLAPMAKKPLKKKAEIKKQQAQPRRKWGLLAAGTISLAGYVWYSNSDYDSNQAKDSLSENVDVARPSGHKSDNKTNESYDKTNVKINQVFDWVKDKLQEKPGERPWISNSVLRQDILTQLENYRQADKIKVEGDQVQGPARYSYEDDDIKFGQDFVRDLPIEFVGIVLVHELMHSLPIHRERMALYKSLIEKFSSLGRFNIASPQTREFLKKMWLPYMIVEMEGRLLEYDFTDHFLAEKKISDKVYYAQLAHKLEGTNQSRLRESFLDISREGLPRTSDGRYDLKRILTDILLLSDATGSDSEVRAAFNMSVIEGAIKINDLNPSFDVEDAMHHPDFQNWVASWALNPNNLDITTQERILILEKSA